MGDVTEVKPFIEDDDDISSSTSSISSLSLTEKSPCKAASSNATKAVSTNEFPRKVRAKSTSKTAKKPSPTKLTSTTQVDQPVASKDKKMNQTLEAELKALIFGNKRIPEEWLQVIVTKEKLVADLLIQCRDSSLIQIWKSCVMD